jgi:hypothetical protein
MEAEKPAAAPVLAAPVSSGPVDEPCPPHMVLEAALGELIRRPLAEYADAIQVLRNEKKFTFREIAEWLKDFNVAADHNAVYREYTKLMPERDAEAEAMKDAHIEENERP